MRYHRILIKLSGGAIAGDTPSGFDRPQTNDVFLTKEGLMYVIDRNRGLHILERA